MTIILPLSYRSLLFSVDTPARPIYLHLCCRWGDLLCTVKNEKNNDLSFLPPSLAGSSVLWSLTPAAVCESLPGGAAVVSECTEDTKTICSFILALTQRPGHFSFGKLSVVGVKHVVSSQPCQALRCMRQ